MMMSVFLLLVMLGLFAQESMAQVQSQFPSFTAVQQGDTVSISCTLSQSVHDRYLSWYLQKPGQGKTLLIDSISTRQSGIPYRFSGSGFGTWFTLQITGVQVEDAGDYYCKSVYITSTRQCGLHGPTLSCLRWVDKSTTHDSWGSGTKIMVSAAPTKAPVTQKPITTKPPTKAPVTQKPITTKPQPSEPAILYLMTPSQEELKDNKTASFACFASEFYPKEHNFIWRWKGTEMTAGVTTLPAVEKKDQTTVYSATSFLRLPESQWREIETYVSCEFEHAAGAIQRTAYHTLSECLPGNPVEVKIIQPSTEELFLQNRVALSCNVTGVLENIDSVVWEREDGETLVSTSETVGTSQIHKLYIKYNDWASGTPYTCIVKHFESAIPIKKTYRRENGSVRQLPSVFIMTPAEKASSNNVTLVCYAKGFYPKEVLFSWFADDKLVDRSKFESTQVVETESGCSAFSQLSISAEDWEKGIVYTCAVHHEAAFNGITKTVVRTVDSVSKKSTTVSLDLGHPRNCPA